MLLQQTSVGLGLTLTGVRCLWDTNDQLTEELRTQRFIMSISSCLVPSPFPTPAPRFCPALPLSVLPVSYLLPMFPRACLQMSLVPRSPSLSVCLMEFLGHLLSRKNCEADSSPSGTRSISSGIAGLCGDSHKESCKAADWNMMEDIQWKHDSMRMFLFAQEHLLHLLVLLNNAECWSLWCHCSADALVLFWSRAIVVVFNISGSPSRQPGPWH